MMIFHLKWKVVILLIFRVQKKVFEDPAFQQICNIAWQFYSQNDQNNVPKIIIKYEISSKGTRNHDQLLQHFF